MLPPASLTANELAALIDSYFAYIEGEFYFEKKPGKEDETGTKKIWEREPEPATFSGLAFFLGFNSRQEFDDYEENGKFAAILKRGRLGIEAIYEKKLHQQSPSGAIFALKSMGWSDKAESKTNNAEAFNTLEIRVVETGPALAGSEQEVLL